MLHDEVLPDLHAARILLERNDDAAWAQAKELLGGGPPADGELLRALPLSSAHAPDGPPAGGSAPAGGGRDGLAVRHGPLCRRRAAPATAARLSPLGAEVVFYAVRELVRNAARHGRSRAEQPLTLTVTVAGGEGLTIRCRTTAQAWMRSRATGGSSQGLALHAAMLAVVGASLGLEPAPGRGVCATILVAHLSDIAYFLIQSANLFISPVHVGEKKWQFRVTCFRAACLLSPRSMSPVRRFRPACISHPRSDLPMNNYKVLNEDQVRKYSRQRLPCIVKDCLDLDIARWSLDYQAYDWSATPGMIPAPGKRI